MNLHMITPTPQPPPEIQLRPVCPKCGSTIFNQRTYGNFTQLHSADFTDGYRHDHWYDMEIGTTDDFDPWHCENNCALPEEIVDILNQLD